MKNEIIKIGHIKLIEEKLWKFCLQVITWRSNQFLVLNIFYFLFLQTFWMLWMLVPCIRHVMCHTRREYQLKTIFKEIYLGLSREWDWSWSHALLIPNVKTLAKKLLAVRPEKETRRRKKKEKKTRMAIAKLFPLNSMDS